jgi:hypothetical protein
MLISVNVTEALTTALSIENENNLLVNDFNKSNNVVKPKLTNAFDDFNVEEEKIEKHNSVIEVDFFTDSISDDEIELLMNKEPSSADVNKEISKSMFDEEDTDLI